MFCFADASTFHWNYGLEKMAFYEKHSEANNV